MFNHQNNSIPHYQNNVYIPQTHHQPFVNNTHTRRLSEQQPYPKPQLFIPNNFLNPNIKYCPP
jgi:hypothetical protein